jgi:dihydrofolate synthase/folylpolyglutamate synthase
MLMETSDAIAFLASLNIPQIEQGAAYGFSAGIERTRQLTRLLGCAQKPGLVITVTGSKGKSSTSCMLSSILQASGYRVGLFTGPHLYDYRERIRVSGEMISPEQLTGYIERVKSLIDAGALGAKPPTTFECLTAIAACFFCENEVDYAVLEVGVGGRLDAVNAIDADVAMFSSISLEHTETLGNSVGAIATEKAGIIRPGAIAVTVAQAPEAIEVLENYCAQKEARLVRVEREWDVRPLQSSIESSRVGQSFALVKKSGPPTPFSSAQEFFVPLLGAHQLTNASLAVATATCLPHSGQAVSPESACQGLAAVHWPGRLEIVRRDPITVVDGAHNPDSAQKLMRALQTTFRYDKLLAVVGIVYSKDIQGIAAAIAPCADEFIAVGFDHRRAAAPQDIVSQLPASFAGRVRSFATLAEGLAYAAQTAAPGDLVCATGSLYIAARARKILLETA